MDDLGKTEEEDQDVNRVSPMKLLKDNKPIKKEAPHRKKEKPGQMDASICRSIPSSKFQSEIRNSITAKKCCRCGKTTEECACTSDEARKEMTKLHETMYDNVKPAAESTADVEKEPSESSKKQQMAASIPRAQNETTTFGHNDTTAPVHDDTTAFGHNNTTAFVRDDTKAFPHNNTTALVKDTQ